MSDKAREYLTPEELSDRWRNAISVSTLANWRAKKPNPGPAYTKMGGAVLYPLAAVVAYEERQTKPAANANAKPDA